MDGSIDKRVDLAALKDRRPRRRLSDTIRTAFDQACDQGDVEVAERLIVILDLILTRLAQLPAVSGQRKITTTADAHQRLWHLARSQRSP